MNNVTELYDSIQRGACATGGGLKGGRWRTLALPKLRAKRGAKEGAFFLVLFLSQGQKKNEYTCRCSPVCSGARLAKYQFVLWLILKHKVQIHQNREIRCLPADLILRKFLARLLRRPQLHKRKVLLQAKETAIHRLLRFKTPARLLRLSERPRRRKWVLTMRTSRFLPK